jgi:hypothetical protein
MTVTYNVQERREAVVSRPAARMFRTWPLSVARSPAVCAIAHKNSCCFVKLELSSDNLRFRSSIWSVMLVRSLQACQYCWRSPIQRIFQDRNCPVARLWTMSKASANLRSMEFSGATRLRTDSPNTNSVVISSVIRKNSGWRSTVPPPFWIVWRRLSTLPWKSSRLSYCLCCRWPRMIFLERFQCSPSCVKMPSPNIGWRTLRRGSMPKSTGTSASTRVLCTFQIYIDLLYRWVELQCWQALW